MAFPDVQVDALLAGGKDARHPRSHERESNGGLGEALRRTPGIFTEGEGSLPQSLEPPSRDVGRTPVPDRARRALP
jgi:hypothetical protein